MSEEVRATVREVNGEIVLDDPDALAVIQVIEKRNCFNTLKSNWERVLYFKNRIKERSLSVLEVVIVLIVVDDPNGRILANMLMPNADWQSIRDRFEIPIARGIASRQDIEEVLGTFDKEAAEKLCANQDLAVVVVDYGVAEIFYLE